MFVVLEINPCGIRKGRPEAVLVAIRIPRCIRGHEIRGFKHQLPILPERFLIGMRSISQFRIENRMWLLPDQEIFQIRRCGVARRANALGPTGTFVSLALRLGFGLGQDALIERKTALGRLTMHRMTYLLEKVAIALLIRSSRSAS